MLWGIFRTADEKVDRFCTGREMVSDDVFAADCGVTSGGEEFRVAIAVRRTIARLGLVDSAFIVAGDRFPEELGMLPLWDSMDWVEFVMCLEEELGLEIPDAVAEKICNERGFEVRELVRRVQNFLPLMAKGKKRGEGLEKRDGQSKSRTR